MNVKFHNPELPSGMEVDIGGILLINGKSMKVDDDELEMFKARNGETLKARFSTNPFVEIDGKPGKVKYLTPDESEATTDTEPPKEGEK
jgi:hypothetical protein